jgi:hypothetical protein
MDAESWLASELATFACAACGEAYGRAHIQLIAQREELFFVDLSCHHCGSQAVAIVTIQLEGEQASVEAGELVRADDSTGVEPAHPPISVDDVLDMHRFLGDFEGDVHEFMMRISGEAR